MTELSPKYVAGFLDALRRVRNEYTNTKDPALKRNWWIQELEILRIVAKDIDPAVAHESLLRPIDELYDSLCGLHFGTATVPLQPVKLSHRPPDPKWAMFRGYAASASELLIRNGATAQVADSWVAERLSRAGHLKSGTSADRRITATTVKGWRKEARERESGDLVRAAFDLCLQKDSPLEKFLPDAEAKYPEYLLEHLSEHGIEERPAHVSRSGMLYALIAIAFARSKFPPPGSSEK